jgi:glycosyltransferase involved in cell wall biosynthesis
MKIVYDHQIFSVQQFGGVSRYFYELANEIGGFDDATVKICAPLYRTEYFSSDDVVRPYGWKVPLVPKIGPMVRVVNNLVSKVALKVHSSVDIFHETYYDTVDICPGKAKRIVTIHDMIHEKFPSSFHENDPTSALKAYAVARADHVICVSRNTQRDLIELLGIAPEKTSVVHLGCSLSVKQADVLPYLSQQPYLLYVGQRGGYKNFEGLLRAYASSQMLRNDFSIVCFGGGALTDMEHRIIRKLGLCPERIRQVSGHDKVLAGLYASAAAFVYPSLYEGFGIPPLEAMSLGCPVVCANASSIPEVVGDAAELFAPQDEQEMCAAVERVVSSPPYANALIDKGHRRVRGFSWKKCAEETMAVYRCVLEGNLCL